MNTSTVDPDARYMTPTGLPLAIICISSVFLFFSIVATGLRVFSRVRDGALGLDDNLAILGTVFFTADVGLLCYACCVGLGSRDDQLNNWQAQEAMKFYVIWILVYVAALAVVKSSVCVSIYRIAATTKMFQITVWVLLFIVWASFFVTFIGTLLYCSPVSTIWNPALVLEHKGHCASVGTFIAIGQVATATTITTDLGLVVLPAMMLWRMKMKTQAKIQAFFLLSFASVASIITMVRIPYINHFKDPIDLKFWVAHIALFSVIETGIGCIATSIPSLRRLFPRYSNPSTNASGPSGGSGSLWTIGRTPPSNGRGDRFRNPTDVGFSLATVHTKPAKESWHRLQDGDSDQGNLLPDLRDGKAIRAEYTYGVEVDRPQT